MAKGTLHNNCPHKSFLMWWKWGKYAAIRVCKFSTELQKGGIAGTDVPSNFMIFATNFGLMGWPKMAASYIWVAPAKRCCQLIVAAGHMQCNAMQWEASNWSCDLRANERRRLYGRTDVHMDIANTRPNRPSGPIRWKRKKLTLMAKGGRVIY